MATLKCGYTGGRKEAGLHVVAEPMRARGREDGGAHEAASRRGARGSRRSPTLPRGHARRAGPVPHPPGVKWPSEAWRPRL